MFVYLAGFTSECRLIPPSHTSRTTYTQNPNKCPVKNKTTINILRNVNSYIRIILQKTKYFLL